MYCEIYILNISLFADHGLETVPVDLRDYLCNVANITVHKLCLSVFFYHEGIININMALKVKAVLVFLLRIPSVSVQSETNKQAKRMKNCSRLFETL